MPGFGQAYVAAKNANRALDIHQTRTQIAQNQDARAQDNQNLLNHARFSIGAVGYSPNSGATGSDMYPGANYGQPTSASGGWYGGIGSGSSGASGGGLSLGGGSSGGSGNGGS